MATEVWGIDIGKSSIKAVKMKVIKKQVEISDIEIVEYGTPEGEEERDEEEKVREGLREFINRKKPKKEKIFISIPGQATFNRMITLPLVDAKRLPEIVKYEAQQQIPFPIEEVIWDYQPITKDGKAIGPELEVMLFAVKKEIINNFLANLKVVNLEADGLQIAPLALYNFIKYDQPELEASVVIDIGAENTDLVVVDGNKLWIRALPSAGNDLTKALLQRFNIPYAEAEKLKIKAGKSKQAKKIFEVMKPVLKDLVGEIHRSVGYYKSMSKDVKFDKMILMGNATKLVGFKNFFSQNLQYKVDILSSLRRIRVSPSVNINLFQDNIATFPVAIGLALQGLELSSNNVRLLPRELQFEKELQRKKPLFALATLLLGGAMGLWYYYETNLNLKLTELKKNIDPTVAKVQAIIQEETTERQKGGTQDKINEILGIGVGRENILSMFLKVNEVLKNTNERIVKENPAGKVWLIEFKSGEVQTIDNDYVLKALCYIGYERKAEKKEDVAYMKEHFQYPLQKYKVEGGEDLFSIGDLVFEYSSTLNVKGSSIGDSKAEKYCIVQIPIQMRLKKKT